MENDTIVETTGRKITKKNLVKVAALAAVTAVGFFVVKNRLNGHDLVEAVN